MPHFSQIRWSFFRISPRYYLSQFSQVIALFHLSRKSQNKKFFEFFQLFAVFIGIEKCRLFFGFLHTAMIFHFFCPLFVVTRYGPSEIGYHVHLVEHSTRVGVLLFAVLHRADESQSARNSCPRLPHSVDFRFGQSYNSNYDCLQAAFVHSS